MRCPSSTLSSDPPRADPCGIRGALDTSRRDRSTAALPGLVPSAQVEVRDALEAHAHSCQHRSDAHVDVPADRKEHDAERDRDASESQPGETPCPGRPRAHRSDHAERVYRAGSRRPGSADLHREDRGAKLVAWASTRFKLRTTRLFVA